MAGVVEVEELDKGLYPRSVLVPAILLLRLGASDHISEMGRHPRFPPHPTASQGASSQEGKCPIYQA